MAEDKNDNNAGRKGARKVRVEFRRNRSGKVRARDWTRAARDEDDNEIDAARGEQVAGKGDVSRRRTVTVYAEGELPAGFRRGVVVAMRGLYAEVDDGERVVSCTVRRVLRSRKTDERHPVTVGDRVQFTVSDASDPQAEGVIEAVAPRCGQLRRHVGRRIHTMVANVDQAVIVASADQPALKPHLIDRYIVSALAGDIAPVICINKMDLDAEGAAAEVGERYRGLGYTVVLVSALGGRGIEAFRSMLEGKSSVIAGQSGVGKSSLLNAVEPGLDLRTGDVNEQINKGRHTTTTATLLPLSFGGYVVDTPGVRTFDLSAVDRSQLEVYFCEFADHVPHCKFPDCTHRHEDRCAVKQAVADGLVSSQRYESYVRMFEEPGQR